MSFLSPMTIAIAAGLTIPPLVALYFLKLKRVIRPVPSTLLWKRAVEDLQVNAPFQRLRRSLLLFLQLLILLLAALALGQPMWQTAETHESTVILLIDQSASMGVVEADGRTRLEQAKSQAKAFVEGLKTGARAMVIAFSDRASVASPFDTDREAVQQRIGEIEQTDSTSQLAEALSLAEAFVQNLVIGLEGQPDIALASDAPPATLVLFTDGRIEDGDRIALRKTDLSKVRVINVGKRKDNVGILAMDARRDYETPAILSVTAAVRNFGDEPVTVDAVLYVEGTNVDVKSIQLGASTAVPRTQPEGPGEGDRRTGLVVFDPVEFSGGGTVEVALHIDDALPADDRAWTIIEAPRRIRVLLVTDGNFLLEDAVAALPCEAVRMTPRAYEAASDEQLLDGKRSAFDVVILDGHSTERLPPGNYFFWGSAPRIEGVSTGREIEDQVIFNWDDTHPILRYVAVEALSVYKWVELKLPPEAQTLIEGETSPVLSYLARDTSQFLICAFRLLDQDDLGNPILNTYWAASLDYVLFMYNSLEYLASNIVTRGTKSVSPGQPVTFPIAGRAESVRILRPDGRTDTVPSAGFQTAHYADTRRVGAYRVEPGVPGHDAFAVNLFSSVESQVEPAPTVTLGANSFTARAGTMDVNRPAWHYFLIAVLILLLLEWLVYNRRIGV